MDSVELLAEEGQVPKHPLLQTMTDLDLQEAALLAGRKHCFLGSVSSSHRMSSEV